MLDFKHDFKHDWIKSGILNHKCEKCDAVIKAEIITNVRDLNISFILELPQSGCISDDEVTIKKLLE